MSEIKQRNSNVELFRILLMLSIVAHHYVMNSGMIVLMEAQPTAWRSVFLFLYGMWGKIGINCFVLITGYYMCRSNITIHKFLKLLLEILFYKISIYIIFALCGYEQFTIGGFISTFNPIGSISRDFISCFLIYYLFIPFLNKLVNSLNRQQHLALIALCVLFSVIWDRVPGVEFVYNYVEWFCILHIIASYLRFYEGECLAFINNRVGLMAIGMVLLAMLSVVFQIYGVAIGITSGWACKWVIDCNAILAVPVSVSLFLYFKNASIPQSKIINTIAASTFGVLLIHANCNTMRQWLWQDICQVTSYYDSPYLVLHAFGCVVGVFLACVAIDKVRIFVLEEPTFKLIDKVLAKYGIK